MSVSFIDGPAKGAVLALGRTPLMLRVVIDDDGTVDALDQLDDIAATTEKIYLYRMTEDLGRAIVCSRGNGCQHLAIAKYGLFEEQPPDEVLRDNAQWTQWCKDNEARLRAS